MNIKGLNTSSSIPWPKSLKVIMYVLAYGFSSVVVLQTCSVCAQGKKVYDPNYKFLKSGNLVVDKNFYLLTVLDHTEEVKTLIQKDTLLSGFFKDHVLLLHDRAHDSSNKVLSMIAGFRYSQDDSSRLSLELHKIYTSNSTAINKMVNRDLRPSGYYQRFIALSNEEFFAKAWAQVFYGTNYILDQFGLGHKMRYPKIDSPSYQVNSRYYRTVIKDMLAFLDEQHGNYTAFYQPSLQVALHLMDANDRDEPARFEPMGAKENSKAYQKALHTKWSNYRYTAIIIPGNGPELYTTPISPDNKIHCDLAVIRYQKGLAPFIITSGGYCYPFRGPYCEALEMKRYLMEKYHVPEDAIIIDPHARHTTTNIRNADRLIIRYHMPLDKLCLFITSKSQHDYAAADSFDKRNLKELGYLPYRDKKSISDHDITFYPVMESLHMDPLDPLDP